MVAVASSPIFLAPMNMSYHSLASFHLGFLLHYCFKVSPKLGGGGGRHGVGQGGGGLGSGRRRC
jgi:hypothetical protein